MSQWSIAKRFIPMAAVAFASAFIYLGCDNNPADSKKGDDGPDLVDIPTAGKSLDSLIMYGHLSLISGQFDEAVAYYEAAYRMDGNDVRAITYSSMARLAAISVEPKVVDLFKNRIGFTQYPNRLNALMSSGWMMAYNDYYWDEDVPLPTMIAPSWVIGGSNSVYNGTLFNNAPTVETWGIIFLANLLDKNTNGLNTLLDQTIDAVFGASFNEVSNRIAKLKGKDMAPLNKDFLMFAGFDDMFDEYDLIGWAELNALISFMTAIKASLEWIASYDWNTNLNFLKFAWTGAEKDWYDRLRDDLAASDLPFNNNFLKARSGKMDAAKATFIKAVEGLQASYTAILTNNNYPQAVKDAYPALNDGANKLIAAVRNGGVFYFPEGDPTKGSVWPTSGNGIDMGKLFTPGYFSLDKLFETEGGKPVFYTAEWECGWSDCYPVNEVKLTAANYIDQLMENWWAGLKFNSGYAAAVAVGSGISADAYEIVDLFPEKYAMLFFQKYNNISPIDTWEQAVERWQWDDYYAPGEKSVKLAKARKR